MNPLVEQYIRQSIRQNLKEQVEQAQNKEKAIYLVHRFPGLKDVMEQLMSPTFSRWISYVGIVAPKPTTLKVDLINGQDFKLVYDGRGVWSAKISGKRYYIKNLPELQRASKAIATLLELNYEPAMSEEEKKDKKSKDIAGELSSFDSGGGGGDGLPDLGPEPSDSEDDNEISDDEFGDLDSGIEDLDTGSPETEDANDDEVDIDI